MTLFDHDIRGVYGDRLDGVVGAPLYSGRALAATEPGDRLRLTAPEMELEAPWVMRHYERVGLSFTSCLVANDAGVRDGEDLSVFYFANRHHLVRPDRRRLAVVGRMNDKNEFVDTCSLLGVPTPQTLCFEGPEEVESVEDLFAFPCFLKTAVDASGMGVWSCKNGDEFNAALACLNRHERFQIQQAVNAAAWLNVMYYAEGGVAHRVVATEQILNGFVHAGNRFPTGYDPWAATDPVAAWMAQNGMRDYFAFDVAALPTPNGVEYLLVECNPRWNGATYFDVAARKLGATAWTARNFVTPRCTLAGLDLGSLEYRPGKSAGAVVINWGTVGLGKLGLLVVGTEDEQREVVNGLEGVLAA